MKAFACSHASPHGMEEGFGRDHGDTRHSTCRSGPDRSGTESAKCSRYRETVQSVRLKKEHAAKKQRLAELSQKERRRAITKTVVTLTATWVLLFVAYFLSPVGKFSSGRPLVQLLFAVVLIGSALAWQVRGIMKADLPELRAVEALGTFIPFFLLTFSFAYLSMSHNDPRSFTQSLDHVRAIYFTVTTFSTTGYGDITPKLDPVRIVAAIQMLIDLALLGAIIRLISRATSKSFGSEESSGD